MACTQQSFTPREEQGWLHLQLAQNSNTDGMYVHYTCKPSTVLALQCIGLPVWGSVLTTLYQYFSHSIGEGSHV